MKSDFIWQYFEEVDMTEVSRVQKIYRGYLDKTEPNKAFFQNLSLPIREFMGLEVVRTVLIQIEPFSNGVIHTDFRDAECDQNGGHTNILSLNIPLENCLDSYTDIWESDHTPKIKYSPGSSVPYNSYPEYLCRKISSFTLDKPVIFRTDLPHSANNKQNQLPRKAISLRFRHDPWQWVNGLDHH